VRIAQLAALSCLAAGSICGMTACGGGGDGGGGEKSLDLTIGDLVPLTGDLSDFGPPGRKAAALAKHQIDQASKQAGTDHTVTLIHQDTETDPQAAVQAARKVVAEGASCLAGAWASAETIPVAQSVSTREGVLQISPASTGDQISNLDDPRGVINRTAPPDNYQGPTAAGFIARQLGGAQGKTVNIGARNDAYGTGLADTFSRAWEKNNGQIGQRVVYDPKQASYDSEAQEIVSGNPDAFFIVDFPETFAKVGPALVRTGQWDPTRTFVTDGLISSQLADSAGATAVNGLRGTAPGSPDAGVAAARFDSLYSKFNPTNIERQTFDAQNFDAVTLCYLSAVAAGSTDGEDMAAQVRKVSAPPGKKYTFIDLAGAIQALQNGDDIDYDGASGPIDMNEKGDATAGVYDTFQFENGQPMAVGEVRITKPST
jgi:ABC-type branched-subunit amino acid transport system substrate-binding protein